MALRSRPPRSPSRRRRLPGRRAIPAAGDTSDVARRATISVRFTQPMDKASTTQAFKVVAGKAAVAGKVTFAEDDTVLVFEPAKALPYGTQGRRCWSRPRPRAADGAPLGAVGQGQLQDGPEAGGPDDRDTRRPEAAARRWRWRRRRGRGRRLGLGRDLLPRTDELHTDRRLGHVQRTCSSPGGRSVAALKLDRGISSKVSRPYAKQLAVGNDCSHFIGGNPGDRLRRGRLHELHLGREPRLPLGQPRTRRSSGSHLFFQAEKPNNGGHYVNLMNAKYDRVGIGVWVSGGRVRLVIDFYHP